MASEDWRISERGPWVYHGLLSASRELRDRARHARNRFQRPSETADLYREPSDWYAGALEEAARVLELRAVEIKIARSEAAVGSAKLTKEA